jgi:hypothetical protein
MYISPAEGRIDQRGALLGRSLSWTTTRGSSKRPSTTCGRLSLETAGRFPMDPRITRECLLESRPAIWILEIMVGNLQPQRHDFPCLSTGLIRISVLSLWDARSFKFSQSGLDAFRYGEFEAEWTGMVGSNVFRSCRRGALIITRQPVASEMRRTPATLRLGSRLRRHLGNI